jgi:hypothetical protein
LISNSTVIKAYYTSIFFLLIHLGVFAQILDDSTKQIYGTHSTIYFKESDILNNQNKGHVLDTSLSGLHTQSFIFEKNTFYQDLGQMGTPAQPYGYVMPDRPGQRYGYNEFEVYEFSPSTINYFDTKSPFSEVSYLQGSRGQQMAQVRFSRNVNSQWNLGFDYRIFTTKKINGLFRKQDYSEGSAFDIYTRYFTPKGRYQVLANFSFYDSQLQETGGIRPDTNDTYWDLFGDITEDIYLRNELTNARKFQYHIYQQYNILDSSNALQIYNVFDYSDRSNWFKQRGLEEDIAFIDAYDLPEEPSHYPYSSYNQVRFKLLENEAGLKGSLTGLYYRLYYRYKEIDYKQNYYNKGLIRKENFVGAKINSFILDSLINIGLSAEKMIDGKDLLVNPEIKHENFSIGYKYLKYSPSLFQTLFAGNYIQWLPSNNLKETTTSNIYAQGSIKRKHYFAKLGLEMFTINNYIYLDEDKLRKQAADNQTIRPLTLKTSIGGNICNIHLENYSQYMQVNGENGGEDLINVPKWNSTTRLYYQNRILRNAAYFQLGIDLNYRSGYFADYYLPNYQHYFLNNSSNLKPYLYADVFLNVQIKNVLAFIKVVNVTQHIRQETSILGPGYFITPGYTGLPRTIFFGLTWRFYN